MNGDLSAAENQDEALVAELHRLGVRHLVRLWPTIIYPPPPAELIAGLAGHRQARFRGALILVFLRRPSLGGSVVGR